MRKKSVFDFNNIDKNLCSEDINILENLYKYCHKKCWLYKIAHNYYQKISGGIIAGGVTLNPIILGTISASGLLIKTFQEIKNYKKKIEMCNFASKLYEKNLAELRGYLRGNKYNLELFNI